MLKVAYRNPLLDKKGVQRFLSVDPLASNMPSWSPYNYTMNNPIKLIDPDGRFPITPEFRQNYPQLTNFIENRLQNYIQGSPKMAAALLKYSTGNLTSSQISSDFSPNSGPTIASHSFTANPNQGGEYDYNSNTIKLSNTELARFEKILGSEDADKQKWGEMDFTKLFINEYTHYGDALDGLDAIQDQNGNVINSDILEPGDFGHGVFDEGNAAAGELFQLPTGRQNFKLYKEGAYYTPTSGKPFLIEKDKIDPTMIPPDKN